MHVQDMMNMMMRLPTITINIDSNYASLPMTAYSCRAEELLDPLFRLLRERNSLLHSKLAPQPQSN